MWSKLEPVRSYVYSLLLPVLAVLVYYGVLTSDSVALWIALGGAVLGVAGTEIARAKVTPVAGDSPDKPVRF